jgi:DNA-binding transcriptional LysR family regulator
MGLRFTLRQLEYFVAIGQAGSIAPASETANVSPPSISAAIPQDVRFEPLASLPPHVLLAADHPLAGEPALAPERLATEPMVLLDLPLSRDYFLSHFVAAGLRPRIAERTRDMAVVRSLVAHGYGYALANVRAGADRAPDGTPLRRVPLAGAPRPITIGLATMRGERQTRLLAAFAAHCRAWLPEIEWG